MPNTSGSLANGLEIAIIGGSIAGCAGAVELSRAGCNVTLFERSGDELKDRGAGLGIPLPTIEMFIERDLVDHDMAYFSAPYFSRLCRTEAEPRFGYHAWDQAISLAAVNWGGLYRNLRQRVPDGVYRSNQKVLAIHASASDRVSVELQDGQRREFDLVVCADGYASLGRRTLYPQIEQNYAGYVLWRGFILESELGDSTPLEKGIHCPGFSGGHGIFYFVPGLDDATEAGRRLVNWGVYMAIADDALPAFLTDKSGRQHEGSLPPGAMPLATERALKDRALRDLPDYYAEITEKSRDTFAYVISDCEVPSYRQGRICLMGDAGAFARPHSGAGALKGVNDAVALSEALQSARSIEQALEAWAAERTAANNELVRFGNQLGQALVKEIPDWSHMSAIDMEAWYTSIVTIKSSYYGANKR